MYRCLVIAPKTDLVLAEKEVTAVATTLRSEVLQDYVSANMVLDKISRGWDIVWFMTHGVEDGVLLSDGPLSASALTTFIRTADARLVVLNTCESIDVALKIHNELLTNLICTLREVPDEEAFLAGRALAFHLSQGKSFSAAYLASKPGQNTNYVFLVGKDKESPSMALSSSSPYRANREPVDHTEAIRRLEALVSGDKLWGHDGLINQVRELNERLSRLERAVLILQIGGGVLVIISLVILMTVIALYASGRV